jgi:hypothetical protein
VKWRGEAGTEWPGIRKGLTDVSSWHDVELRFTYVRILTLSGPMSRAGCSYSFRPGFCPNTSVDAARNIEAFPFRHNSSTAELRIDPLDADYHCGRPR